MLAYPSRNLESNFQSGKSRRIHRLRIYQLLKRLNSKILNNILVNTAYTHLQVKDFFRASTTFSDLLKNTFGGNY